MIALMPVVPFLAHAPAGWHSRARRRPRPSILVELFTSEGCSSCPPADALLTRLLREQPVAGVEIVPLSFHVDYWDHQGWRDPFSAKAFSVRQEAYSKIFGDGRVYTPQMIVDGHDEFNGSDEGAARKFLQAAAERPHLPLRIDARAQGPTVRLTIDLPAAPADGEPVDVVVALTEDDLTSACSAARTAAARSRIPPSCASWNRSERSSARRSSPTGS